ncbi:SGNH/GDSL hydrolase family protein [Candidatus Blastococcus massiliensis]|uniref:SGNH/GDSL hydrolase family protein n=1 Tax=Candidatus Blastococcus massiliensis TaxID=1470358 RepID=UPI0004BA45EE|nr:SGNH/GDSL hydrolase family protein [Candidatus Blastococcus massiliensis]
MARAPDRPGFFRSLPLPSRAEGLIILAVLLVMAIGVGLSAWYASNRTPPVFEPPEGAAAAADPTTAPDAPDAPPVLAFYGDFLTAGTPQGGQGPAGWPALVTERLDAEGTPPHAVADAGYVADAAVTGDTFLTLVERFPEPDADVTVVFGSRNDYLAAPSVITAAATRTFDAIRASAPDTRLVVIGPAWTDAVVPPEIRRVRDAVQQAAVAAGVTFVDPLAGRWFFDELGLIASDLVSPTDQGHVHMADRIEPVLRDVLADVAAGTPTGTAGATP